MSKYPTCECRATRYSYHRKRYRNGTLHLMRQCPHCGKTAQNPLPQRELDSQWVDTLPILENGVMEQPVLSRADAALAKLHNHIENRRVS